MVIGPQAQVVLDRSQEVIENLEKLAAIQVMVGIPATRNYRDDGVPITNSALGYIHEFGSPVRNIPARPFLRPGVANALGDIRKRLASAAKAAIQGNGEAMRVQLESAGVVAVSSVQQKITDGPFTPLAASTLARRRAKLKGTTALTKGQRAQGFAAIRPLIDTGQLRRAITYVLRDRRGTDIGGKP